MLDLIRDAKADHVQMIVFPEMAVPGYLIGDEWEHISFLRECEDCGQELGAASQGITVIFGSVGIDWKRRNEDGRVRKYSALFVADDGRFVGPSGSPYNFVIKALLPNYREFDDSRHFFDLRKLAMEERRPVEELTAPVKTRLAVLGCALCEDAWNMDYSISPLDLLARKGAQVLVNISCSPFTMHKNHKRNRVFSTHAHNLQCPLIYVNNVGIQNNGKTVFTFDGSSCIYDSHGNQAVCGRPFEESLLTFDLPLDPSAKFGAAVELKYDGVEDIYAAIGYGTRKFMDLCKVNRITVGVSGGIDSAVVASIYRRLLNPEDLLLVNLPSRYNSATTRSLARTLAANLEAYYAEIPIEDSVKLTCSQIDNLALRNVGGNLERKLELSGLMQENIQARDRSSRVLAAVSAAFGGVFTCNANKTEATVGYTTLYGDLCGYLANLADLWKMEVYELGHYLNKTVFGREIIPQGIFDVTPSAELSTAQNVDEKKGDPLLYPYHDALFRSWIESWNRTTPEEILDWYDAGVLEQKLGYDGKISALFENAAAFVADLERWWNQYQGIAVAKRIQAPPVLAIKKRAFGFDHRESQMGSRYTKRYETLKKKILKL
jgi:NAD+ synthase (glutamine-hydrolysing)